MLAFLRKDGATAGGRPAPKVVIPGEIPFRTDGCSARFSVCGIVRARESFKPGDAISLDFTADEMSAVEPGIHMGELCVLFPGGGRYTLSQTVRILFTDEPSDVYGAQCEEVDAPASSGGIDLHDIEFDPDASQETINGVLAEIVRRGGGVIRSIMMAAALVAMSASAEDSFSTARFGDLTRNSTVVTNIPYMVQSVNGQTGAVNLNAGDVGALSTEGGTVKGTIVMYTDFTPANLQVGAGGYGGILEVYSGADQPASIQKDGQEVATEDQVEAVSNRVESLGTTVNAWQTYWDGDDVRLTVTNYYGSLDIPSLYLEQKMPAGDGHDAPWFRVVWDERTRWNTFMPAFTAVTNEVAQNKADRAWGVYDSSTGAYSPDGLLQLSQEQIMIASGMAWQKTITTGGGSVWILTSTIPFVMSGESTNGFFRIEDGDGHTLFEIVKGDKKIVPATPTSVVNSQDGFCVGFSVDSSKYQHPVGEVALCLHGPFVPEDSLDGLYVAWTGDSGNWVATVSATPPHAMPKTMFFRASYESGGNTYIRNNVATSIDKVVVGGHEYTVTVENIGGKNLMVLK